MRMFLLLSPPVSIEESCDSEHYTLYYFAEKVTWSRQTSYSKSTAIPKKSTGKTFMRMVTNQKENKRRVVS